MTSSNSTGYLRGIPAAILGFYMFLTNPQSCHVGNNYTSQAFRENLTCVVISNMTTLGMKDISRQSENR
jgi:hypothetical protein